MNHFKKIISLTLIVSQIGCANHVVHSSLSNAGFDPNYSYTIKTNQNVTFPNVPGVTLQNQTDRVYMTQNGQTQYLLHNQISTIEGQSYRDEGTYAGVGAAIGGTTLGILSGVLTLATINSDSESDCYDGCVSGNILAFLLGGGIGAILGGFVGMGIGAAIPKKSQIQITPTFSQSSNNMGAGANLSVRF